MAGIDLAPELLAEEPGIVVRWQLACRSAGVLVRPLGSGIAVSPPLIVDEDELAILASGIERGLEVLERSLHPVASQPRRRRSREPSKPQPNEDILEASHVRFHQPAGGRRVALFDR